MEPPSLPPSSSPRRISSTRPTTPPRTDSAETGKKKKKKRNGTLASAASSRELLSEAERKERPRTWPTNWQPACHGAIRAHEGPVNCSRVFANDTRVLTAGEDGQLRVFDIKTGLSVGTPLIGHDGPVNDCCILKDDKTAISCGSDGALRVWSLETFSCLKEFGESHAEPINDIDVYKEGDLEYCLSASDDKTLKVWDTDAGRCIATLEGTEGEVKSCTVYMGVTGRECLSGGADNHVRRWALNRGRGESEDFGRELKQTDDTPWLSKANALKGKEGHTGLVNACAVTTDGLRALTCSGDRSAIVCKSTSNLASLFR